MQATSALDNASEHVVQQALDRLAKVSVCSWRPCSVLKADQAVPVSLQLTSWHMFA